MTLSRPVLVGRSSSHFTRVSRVFAAEAGIAYDFRVVRELTSLDPNDYAGNPALKLPSLETATGVWYGALPICRELIRRSSRPLCLVWPEDLVRPELSNAQELVLQAMATEVILILRKAAGEAASEKAVRSLTYSLAWLDANLPELQAALPPKRDLSFLEVTLCCLVRHLEFRKILSTTPYERLLDFCRSFENRESLRTTEFVFDP